MDSKTAQRRILCMCFTALKQLLLHCLQLLSILKVIINDDTYNAWWYW